MSINGKRDDLSLDDLYEVAISNTIKSYKHIINEIIDTVSKWKEFAKEAGVEKSFTKEISNNHRLTIAKSL